MVAGLPARAANSAGCAVTAVPPKSESPGAAGGAAAAAAVGSAGPPFPPPCTCCGCGCDPPCPLNCCSSCTPVAPTLGRSWKEGRIDGTLLLLLLLVVVSSSVVVDRGLPDLLPLADALPLRLDIVPFWLDCCARRTCRYKIAATAAREVQHMFVACHFNMLMPFSPDLQTNKAHQKQQQHQQQKAQL